MEKVADKGDEELYNKLDVAYASSDEETEETDVRIRLCFVWFSIFPKIIFKV